jgi:2-polyprenyl-3-methyl-5-hydroxy-6-metoxy-1,4-benzoquinol methylase
MQTHSGSVIAQRDGLTVIDCRACGWAHLDPLPTVDDAYYRDTFWSEKGAGWLAKYEAERDWLDMRHGDWLTLAQDHSDGKGGRTLLDVGCGYGFFLQVAKRRLWGVAGIEPSQEAYQYCHNDFPVWPSTWESFGDMTTGFDCISALWLMEHLPDPRAFLVWCRAHLAPGGVLLMAVPQEWTYPQLAANTTSAVRNWWLHPTHLHYWNAATLYGLLGRAGFRVVDALASFPIENYIRTGHDYTADESLGDKVHAAVRAKELRLSRAERLQYQREAARESWGRDLAVFCTVDA